MNDSFDFQSGLDFDLSSFQSVSGPEDGCTQCGICLPSCPTYKVTEDFDQSPMGRIKLIRQLKAPDDATNVKAIKENLESCLTCQQCEKVCPSKVDYVKLRDQALADLDKIGPKNLKLSLLMYWSEKQSGKGLAQLVKRAFNINFVRSTFSELQLPRLFGLGGSSFGRNKKPFRFIETTENITKKVVLFESCVSGIAEPQVSNATRFVLRAAGVDVSEVKNQACCGSLHRHNGSLEEAAELAKTNIRTLLDVNADAVISLASGCGKGLKDYSTWLDADDSDYAGAMTLASQTKDICDFIHESNLLEKLRLNPVNKHIVVHTPCSKRDSFDYNDPVATILENIPGLKVTTLPQQIVCCGAGGSHLMTHAKQATTILQETLSAINTNKPDLVVSSNVGCALHLRSELKELPVLHPIEILANAIDGGIPSTNT